MSVKFQEEQQKKQNYLNTELYMQHIIEHIKIPNINAAIKSVDINNNL